MTSFKVLYVISIMITLAAGYFLGAKYNPKPAKVVVEKITEEKTVEKEIKYDVIVEKQVSSLPNFVVYNGQELDCYEVAKLHLNTKPDLNASSAKPDTTALKTLRHAISLYEQSLDEYNKSTLLKKIKCRSELSRDEIQALAELVQVILPAGINKYEY